MMFKAFISYKHSELGRKQAIALETALKKYAKPLFKPPMKIFRDEKQMTTGSSLSKIICKGLDNSEYLIHLAEKEAANSVWVQEELEYWCKDLNKIENLIIIHISDTIALDLETNQIDWEKTDALPAVLKPYLPTIPLYIDLTWAQKPRDRDLNNVNFKTIINKLVAQFRNLSPEEMNDEEIMNFHKTQRLRKIAIGSIGSLLFLLLFSMGFLYFELQKNKRIISYFGYSEDRAWVYKHGKFAIINHKGKKLTDFIYTDPSPFEGGYAIARLGVQYAIIDINGKLATDSLFDLLLKTETGVFKVSRNNMNAFYSPNGKRISDWYDYISPFNFGLAKVMKGQTFHAKYGFIDKNGKEIIPLIYGEAGEFSEGKVVVGVGKYEDHIFAGSYGAIDTAGKVIVPIEYKSMTPFFKSKSIFVKGDILGIIDEKGAVIKQLPYNYTTSFTDNYVRVHKNWKIGIIDLNGKEIIAPNFDNISSYSDGLFTVSNNNLHGLIDSTGKIIISPAYEFIGTFNNGLALVSRNGKYQYINKLGEIVFEAKSEFPGQFSEGLATFSVEKPGLSAKIGYIGTDGKEVLPAIYDAATDFSEGLAFIGKGKTNGPFYTGKMAIIDKSGRQITDFQWNFVTHFKEGFAVVGKGGFRSFDNAPEYNGKFGYIDKTGKPITEIQFDSAHDFSNGFAAVNVKGKWGYINTEGQLIIDFEYEEAQNFVKGVAKVSKSGNIFWINSKKELVEIKNNL